MYNECIQLTRQFTFCPNAFRVDLYKGCDFGCKYCFANMDGFKITDTDDKIADISKIQKLFYKALETDKDSKDILVELIRHHVPIHCGGMSDSFQSREQHYHLTKQLIELSNKYNYPIQFSTKTASLPDDYFGILNPDIHIFQVSIIGWDEDYVRKWECNTPTAQERLEFVKLLRSKGFWCSIRIQPIIDILQCEKLCYNIGSDVDYVTLEHFKLIYDTEQAKNAFMKLCDNKTDFEVAQHKLQMKRNIKIQNIKRLQTILNKNGVLVGVGDNDLHYMSQSRCCCGIDVARESFKNYLKYNLTYMTTGEIDKNTFIPQCNSRKHINDQKYGLKIDCKQYVEDYIANHLDYCGDCKHNIEKQLFGISKTKLF